MRFTEWKDCDMLPSGWRSDCYQDMSFLGYYETPAILPVGWPVLLVSLAYIVAVVFSVRAVLHNGGLSRSQKIGYSLGMIGVLPVFLPLYLVFTGGRAERGLPDAP